MKLIALGLLCASLLAGRQVVATVGAPVAFPQVDAIFDDAVRTGLIPGAVLVIGHNRDIVYRKAYGSRALIPAREPMTVDTIFDVASLTKVVATTPSIMKLFEEGKIRIDDPVTKYLPEFQGGKSQITIRLLMTHFSGFRPDFEMGEPWSGYQAGVEKALAEKPIAPPGARFIYSDTNFILLGEIVRRLSGETLAQFAHEQIYAPLRMNDTGFLPSPSLIPRIAPTEIDTATGKVERGVVNDPRSHAMGGVAGHAGLFGTADDLAKYAGMMLGMGEYRGIRIFDPATVKKFTEPATPADQPILRALGWDMDSPYSSNRGELFPIGSFGHTGWTGTSMWMDPTTNSFVIILTNVVHPKHGKSLVSFRSRVATAVAAHYGMLIPNSVALTGYTDTIANAGVHRVISRNAQTLTGLDVLEQQGFNELKGKRLGLITNHTGLDSQGSRNIDAMLAAGVQIKRLFSPEHGINGTKDEAVGNSRDEKTGLPVISLFQPNQRRLSEDQLRDIDAIVFDIQDVGSRFYTYSCTMLYALEAAAKAKKTFYVLDRPNPITGTHVEGPTLEQPLESFVGCLDVPLRHGMTFGELATMANAEQHWGADLHVVKMSNWERGDWFDSTGLAWVDPSPNMRSLNAALLYPGLAMIEANKNYSVGRGTDAPFEQIGADWMDGKVLAEYLNARFIPGVRVYPTRFRPVDSNFSGEEIQGIRFVITDREAFDSTRLGIEVIVAIQRLFPGKIDLQKCRFLIGNSETIRLLEASSDAGEIWNRVEAQASEFADRRKPYLLY
ncbi:MAG TPA: exo-beta-N-acetylmuramidase NamZ domain-containing protein [Bryobacteraceae bacterium]|nr:exo-beta-N-acetylmuramidase NamZ domain-containing protein [Bryobacteraceae bacterium]